jgi:hypothetical protein
LWEAVLAAGVPLNHSELRIRDGDAWARAVSGDGAAPVDGYVDQDYDTCADWVRIDAREFMASMEAKCAHVATSSK